MAAQLRGKLLHEVAHLTKVIIIVELAAAPLKFPKAQQRESPVMLSWQGIGLQDLLHRSSAKPQNIAPHNLASVCI